jgi:NOL1/NOP2/fmu family ribosome biogenesis protein
MTIPLKFFTKQEKEKLIQQLNNQFGITELPWEVAKLGKERIILFSGDMSEKELIKFDYLARVEGVGLYFAKIDEHTKDIRLSIEGANLLKDQITKNIFEMNEEQTDQWMLGQELNITTGKKGFFVMKFKNDILGTGKISENKISNFVPKSRRLRFKEKKLNTEETKE